MEHKGLILALVCLAQFMVVLDISIVNVALPSIEDELGLTTSGLQWVVNAYTITFAGLLLLGGRAADIFGQKKLFVLGAAIFGVASLAGGLANDETTLVIARAFQGVGGAVLSPATLTILTTTFAEGRERSKAMGLWSAVAGAGGAAGALLGGVLTDLVDWRWIFLINVPIAILGVVGAFRLLKARNERMVASLDSAGAILVTSGLIALVYAIVQTEQHGWLATRTVATAAAAVVLLTWFVLHESKVASKPLMPMSLWRYPSLTVANISMLFLASGMFAMWFLLTMALQNVLGYSALEAGLAFLPMTIAIIVGTQISSRIMHRTGARPLVALGPAVAAVGLAMLSQIDSDSTYVTDIMIGGMLATFGMGFCMTPVVTLAMAGVKREEHGLASGLINTSRQVGGSIGLAALSTLAANRTSQATGVDPAEALMQGYDAGLIAGAGLVLLASLVILAAAPKASGQRKKEVDLSPAEPLEA
jgi:EmrB/QacA subfamily drug resistance transporter